ncbi:hypothetical protein Tco_1149974 [Tanacetum coccineum]
MRNHIVSVPVPNFDQEVNNVTLWKTKAGQYETSLLIKLGKIGGVVGVLWTGVILFGSQTALPNTPLYSGWLFKVDFQSKTDLKSGILRSN